MPEYVAKENKTFLDRILEHLERILEISTKEFVAGYWEKKIQGNYTEEVYHPDQRKCFIQSVESFADILSPFFDLDKTGEIEKDFEEIEKQKSKILEDFENKKLNKDRYIILKLRLIQKLFRRLNLFLRQSGITKIKTAKKFG